MTRKTRLPEPPSRQTVKENIVALTAAWREADAAAKEADDAAERLRQQLEAWKQFERSLYATPQPQPQRPRQPPVLPDADDDAGDLGDGPPYP